MLSNPQVSTYLAKLGFNEPVSPTRESLDALISAHQLTIPFSTIGIHRAQDAPNLSTDALYDKVIEKGMGGYCFELNKLFQLLLESQGFDAAPALCRAVRGRDARMPINHRGIVVTLDGEMLFADVGFGGPMPAGALSLRDGEEQTINGETYIAERASDTWWKIDRITKAKGDLHDDDKPSCRQTELELCTAEVDDIDFAALSLACSQPGTLFRDHEVVNLRTKYGHMGYKDGALTIRENGSKRVLEIKSKPEQDEVLRQRFGMSIS